MRMTMSESAALLGNERVHAVPVVSGQEIEERQHFFLQFASVIMHYDNDKTFIYSYCTIHIHYSFYFFLELEILHFFLLLQHFFIFILVRNDKE